MAQGFNLDGYENGLNAQKIADIFLGMFPTCILNVGGQMYATIKDNNTVRVSDGVAMKEGRVAIIDASSYDDFTIPDGSQGVTANYYIGYHFFTNSSGKQDIEKVVSATKTTTTGFRSGGSELYMWLYKATLNGVVLESVTALVPVVSLAYIATGTAEPNDSDLQPDNTIYFKYEE